MTRWPRRFHSDEGAAVVEFVVLVVLVLVPVVYVVLAATRVQAGAYAVTQAAREAGRAFVQANSPGEGASDARLATAIALRDQGFDLRPGTLSVDCGDGRCLTPGSTIHVSVSLRVALPFLPDSLAESTAGSIRVSADHVVPVDEYRGMP